MNEEDFEELCKIYEEQELDVICLLCGTPSHLCDYDCPIYIKKRGG